MPGLCDDTYPNSLFHAASFLRSTLKDDDCLDFPLLIILFINIILDQQKKQTRCKGKEYIHG